MTKKKTDGAQELYRDFHGTNPRGARMVKVPYPQRALMKLGEVSQINYRPSAPSQHNGTEFFHKSGDTGDRMLKSNLILATDGENLFLIKSDPNSRYPYVNERGIIG
jgi:hypothetical protein